MIRSSTKYRICFCRFSEGRFKALRGELAAATFLVHRNAAVRFHGSDRWIARDKETGNVDLPRKYVEGYKVEAIDMRDFAIQCHGFENLRGLEHLRSLALRNQPLVNDWFIDTITALFSKTLEYLDVSGCDNVTERGLAVLHRCRKLRILHLENMKNVGNIELLAIHLEEVLPDLTVEGVNYWEHANA